MRFLLVTGLERKKVKVWVCQETSPAGSLLPPVDLASIASALRSKGHEVVISDLRLARDPLAEYVRRIKDSGTDAIVLNVSTTSANSDYKILENTPKQVKKICFGTHAQYFPDECFKKGADFVLAGDPEFCILSLIESGFNVSNQRGIWDSTSKNGFYYTDNLDEIAFPALDLLDMHRYHAPYIRRGNLFTLLLGSRGCPYPCTYCLYPSFFGKNYRTRSAGNIAGEIEQDMKRYNIKEFYFLDATFNIDEKRVAGICEEIIGRKLEVRWSCNMRVWPASGGILKMMKKAGCSRIFYGVEDQELLGETGKRIDPALTEEAFRRTREAGIATVAFVMLFPRSGISEGTYSRRVLSTLKKLKADAFQCNIAIPYPGTEMYEAAKRKAVASGDWDTYDPHGHTLPYKSDIDLIRVKKGVYSRFILQNPRAIFNLMGNLDARSFASLLSAYCRMHLSNRK